MSLTAIERSDEDCILRFADGASFRIGYLSIRKRCQCAKCKPRQANEQRRMEFEEEIECRGCGQVCNQASLADGLLKWDTFIHPLEGNS